MTSINVNGQTQYLPGIYSTIKSGINNTPQQTPYGNVCIIDSGTNYSNLCSTAVGVAGTRIQGEDTLLEFSTIDEMRKVCSYGRLWKLAEYLFFPAGIRNQNIKGVSKVYYIKSSATAPATTSITAGGTSITFTTKEEGVSCNGVVNGTSTLLETGYALKFSAGIVTTTALVLTLYKGAYKGLDTNGLPFDGFTADKTIPNIVVKSPEFTTTSQLLQWATTSDVFSSYLTISGTTNTTVISNGEITTIGAGYKLFTGGTDTNNFQNFDNTFQFLANADINMFLAPDNGTTAYSSTFNARMFYHVLNDNKRPVMYCGFGNNKSEFASSVSLSKSYNSERIVGVHGGFFEDISFSSQPIERNSYYKAAIIMARVAGLEPQIPVTFKKLYYLSENHQLTQLEKEQLVQAGCLFTNKDSDLGIVVAAGINTIQRNTYLVNQEDGSSYEISVERIKHQLNREIVSTGKKVFFGTENGANRGTFSQDDVKNWLRKFLDTKTASVGKDGLIVRQGNIAVTVNQDSYFVEYEFVPNFPINKMLFTGIMLEA